MKKRILHVLNTSSYSGAENVVISIIKKMDEEYECVYASLDGPIRNVLDDYGIRFMPVKKVSILEVRRIVKLFKPDIIHAHDYTASIICAVSGVKSQIISHLHNNSPWIKSFHPNSFLYLISNLRYERILTVSRSICNEYVFGKLIEKKTSVISNPVDTNKIINKSKEEHEHPEKYDMVFLGRLVQAKNPLRFISLIRKVADKYPDVRVAIIGDGPLSEQCKMKIFELNLIENVKMMGFKSNPYVILASAKVLCMTSIWEGYGLVAIESLALGVPVVATPAGGLPEILNDKCGFLTNDENIYVSEVIKLLSDQKYWKVKSTRAKNRALELNNIEGYINKLKDLYNSL